MTQFIAIFVEKNSFTGK